MVHQERSAGVIVFRLGGERREVAQFLLLDYGKYWDYAKGHVEKGEDDPTAARRELREETGIAAVELIGGFSREVAYFFRSKRGLVRKSVVFFLGRVESNAVQLSEEHVGYEWLAFDAALERVNYASAKEVLRAAAEFLKTHKTRD